MLIKGVLTDNYEAIDWHCAGRVTAYDLLDNYGYW